MNVIKKIFTFSLVFMILAVIAMTGICVVGTIYARNTIAKYEDKPTLLQKLNQSSVIYDANNNVLTTLNGEANRKIVPIGQIPPNVKNAFLAIEDARFYSHHGVDPIGIARAFYSYLKTGTFSQGGSTITQQLMKQTFLSSEKSFWRKGKEAFLALEFERHYTKDEILELYLNQVYYGEGAYGIGRAAQVYFNKDVSELNLQEGAMLAGLMQAPSAYDPYTYPKAALNRRNQVLDAMDRLGDINNQEKTFAENTPINLSRGSSGNDYSYYSDYVVTEVDKVLGDEGLSAKGLKIYTSLDPQLQKTVDDTINSYKNFPDQTVQIASVILDNDTAEIKAMIGGRDYSTKRGLNRATQMLRQPGSSFKPMAVYGPAFETGDYTPDSMIQDIPLNIAGYSPKNSDGWYGGSMTIRQAIALSHNAAAVWLLNEIGVNTGYNFAQRFGFNLEPEDRNLSLALGGLTKGVTPLQMAGAYSTFARGGTYMEPHAIKYIEDADGNVIYKATNESKRIMKEQTAQYVTSILENAVNTGTGTRAIIPGVPVAGKTGTTELPDTATFRGLTGNKDNWFCGFTPRYAAAFWLGYDEKDMSRKNYLQTFGGDIPAQLFSMIISKAGGSADNQAKSFNYSLINNQEEWSQGVTSAPDTQSDQVPADNEATNKDDQSATDRNTGVKNPPTVDLNPSVNDQPPIGIKPNNNQVPANNFNDQQYRSSNRNNLFYHNYQSR